MNEGEHYGTYMDPSYLGPIFSTPVRNMITLYIIALLTLLFCVGMLTVAIWSELWFISALAICTIVLCCICITKIPRRFEVHKGFIKIVKFPPTIIQMGNFTDVKVYTGRLFPCVRVYKDQKNYYAALLF
mmetsp:Transcript_20516/g.31351  ORF Transcript_20516/g.31351 Transcript_20516/m.31351 type:complete len:130 (+) Transcript_20516:111-500(+)